MDAIRVAKVDNVLLWRQLLPSPPGPSPRHQRLQGTLHLTPHHLIFSPSADSDNASLAEIWISYPTITLLTRLPQALGGLYPMQINTKLFESFTLIFERDREGGAEDVWQSVKDCSVASSVEQLYAFFYTSPSSSSTPGPGPGWSTFNPRQEFARQGLGTRTKAWRFTDINRNYDYCPTYPAKMAVPSRISDSVLSYAGKYRSKGRIPALTYLHWANHASITRSSQPMVGLKNARSAQDEKLIECIFSSHLSAETAYATPPTLPPPVTTSQSLPAVYGATTTNLIIDARPTTNAMANVAKGAGTENMENYKSGKKTYLGIDNIHVMRNSLNIIVEALKETETGRTVVDRGLLRKSNWLRHISTLLDGALVIIKNVHINSSHVLIHCSDGWDRTAQLSATAQICLDPYYRTLEGFKVLIEKDWLAFGHKFLDRSGHLSSEKHFTVTTGNPTEEDSDDEIGVGAQKAAQAFLASFQKQFSSNSHLKEVSPVFHQFLDCVRQIQRQFPERFEFNEDYLLDLHSHLYSCQFGTFLFNSESSRREPVDGGRPWIERTVSVWDHLDESKYVNDSYDAKLDDRESREPNADLGVLMLDPKDVRFWFRLFKKGDDEMNGSKVLAQAVGVESIGPLGADSVDPVQVPYKAREKAESPSGLQRIEKPSASSSSSSSWGWSQFSTGAMTAIQGAAREIKSFVGDENGVGETGAGAGEKGQEGEMWGKSRERELPSVGLPKSSVRIPSETNPWSTNPPSQLPSTKPAPFTPSVIPPTTRTISESRNPWVASVETSRPPVEKIETRTESSFPSLSDLSLLEMPMPTVGQSSKEKEKDREMEEAALGGDRKAWDPLGAL
ncbi:myotubularin-related protein 6/7/8, partial [Tremellales sp. Uapishka_1]